VSAVAVIPRCPWASAPELAIAQSGIFHAEYLNTCRSGSSSVPWDTTEPSSPRDQ
jgi:hypothetical protein